MADMGGTPAGNAVPPPIHHEGPGRRNFPAHRKADAPHQTAEHQTASHQTAGHQRAGHQTTEHQTAGHQGAGHQRAGAGAWVLYLVLLAGIAIGLYITWQGSKNAARGAAVVGCSLLVAALARLVLPPRHAGPLSSRGKTSDVLAFTALGAGVLGVALMLP